MNTALADALFRKELITSSEKENILREKPISVHWDLHTLLYLGVLLITSAVGIFIYKNIDSIGHDVMLIAITLLVIICFAYCFKKSNGYQHTKVNMQEIAADYILLAGCLLLLTLIGYAQFQYNLFGNRWGLALFIPMILLFAAAYYFDHLGVLSLAIVNLAAWAGIAITPTTILQQNNFNEEKIMFTGLALGALLVAMARWSSIKQVKAHFAFTYKIFGIHIFFISLLAILFYYDRIYFLIFLALIVSSFFLYRNAIKEQSAYFLVVTLLYSYIGLSYVVVQIIGSGSMASTYGIVIYFIFSGIGFIVLFKQLQQKLKSS